VIHPSDLPHVDTLAVDFRRSIPPRIASLDTHLSTALVELAERGDLNQLMRQSVARGSEADRAAGHVWLTPRFGEAPDASRIVVTNGTQNTVLMLLRVLVGSGGVLLAERLSYGVLRALGRLAGIEVHGVEIDDEGLVPDALEAACRRFHPKALYCNPTVHNPTTSIMSIQRRSEIAAIARRHDIAIIEDDALGRLHADSPPPIAALAPDITWYVTTLTKSLTQGWRLAYLVTPDQPLAQRRLAPIENLSCWHCSPLVAAITNLWVADGTAARITDEIAQECLLRERIAREMFAYLDVRSVPGSMHLWLRLPDALPRADVIAKAERLGVLLRPSDMFAVDDQPAPNALRLSLSPPATLDEVRRGLRSVRQVIDGAR
jgi:DNA-binding transcriptional MocR family regulator